MARASRVGGRTLDSRLSTLDLSPRVSRLLLAAATVGIVAIGALPRPARGAGADPAAPGPAGAFLCEVGDGRDAALGYWPLETLPARVVAATVAIEDRRFWLHPGVDPLAVGRAAWQNLRTAGGSPAPRPWPCRWRACSGPGARTLPRKAVEAVTAFSPDRPLRPRGAARPLPAHRPLRQPDPRHRLRGAPLPRQAGRGPVLGGDRLPLGHPPGPGRHEPLPPLRPAARRGARRAHPGAACASRA